MTATANIKGRLLDRYGVRAGPAMCAYVGRRLSAGDPAGFPILAGDARTGLPVRRTVVPAEMAAAGAAG